MTNTLPRQAAPPAEKTFEELAGAVDEAMKASASLDGQARKVVDALREAIEGAHRAALVTIVRRLRQDDAGKAALYELVDDPLVHMLFSLHGIIRADPMTQGRAALDVIRPGLHSHGGDVELVSIEDGTAYVRLSGACNGCSMASVTMRTTVEEALMSGASTVTAVEVLPSEPAPAAPAVLQLGVTRRRDDGTDAAAVAVAPPVSAEQGWVAAMAAGEVPDGRITALQLRDAADRPVDVILVRIGANMSAYANECAHQGMPLDDAELDLQTGEIVCAWHGFCYEAMSGECTTAVGATLEQYPLRVDDGQVWVRVG